MGEGDSRYDSRLLKVTYNKLPQTEQYLSYKLMLLCLENFMNLVRTVFITSVQRKVHLWQTSGSGSLCEVVLLLAPAWRSTLTTLGWAQKDAAIRGVTPFCEGSDGNSTK